MILSVTLNPCLDKTLTVRAWKPGDNIRGHQLREVAGGKGNNVARALKWLGRSVRPVTFFGGAVGERCERLLRKYDGFDPIVTPTVAETRVILTVRTEGTADQTAFFDPDPKISADEALAFLHRVEGSLAANPVEALTLSGSSPSESTHELYSELIALGRSKGIPVFLDTYGPPLDAIWGFWPDGIQINRREAGIHLRKTSLTESDLVGLLLRWERHSVTSAIITDGPNPALARVRDQIYRVTPPKIEAVNPIGSGDCLLAGTVNAMLGYLESEALLRHAFACAVANALVWDAGAIEPDVVKRLETEIVIEPIAPY